VFDLTEFHYLDDFVIKAFAEFLLTKYLKMWQNYLGAFDLEELSLDRLTQAFKKLSLEAFTEDLVFKN
jgi:hypothetical protein